MHHRNRSFKLRVQPKEEMNRTLWKLLLKANDGIY